MRTCTVYVNAFIRTRYPIYNWRMYADCLRGLIKTIRFRPWFRIRLQHVTLIMHVCQHRRWGQSFPSQRPAVHPWWPLCHQLSRFVFGRKSGNSIGSNALTQSCVYDYGIYSLSSPRRLMTAFIAPYWILTFLVRYRPKLSNAALWSHRGNIHCCKCSKSWTIMNRYEEGGTSFYYCIEAIFWMIAQQTTKVYSTWRIIYDCTTRQLTPGVFIGWIRMSKCDGHR